MSKLELRTQVVGPWPMNTYALACPQTGESILSTRALTQTR